MAVATESDLLDRALAELQQATSGRVSAERLDESRSVSDRWHADARIAVVCDGVSHRFLCEIKSTLDLRAIPAAATTIATIQRRTREAVVLVTEHVSRRLAAALLEQGVQFIDGAGNAHLASDGFFLLLTGRSRRKPKLQRRLDVRTTWGRGALPVVHRLLNEPEALERSYRDLASASTVSLGTVHNVMDDLKARGFLRKLKGRTRLVERERLTEQWVESYPQYLRERLIRRRYALPAREDRARLTERSKASIGEQDWIFSGECAAWLMDGYLPPERMTVYGNGDLDALASLLGARPAADGPIEVLHAFWTGHTSPGGDWGLADPILVYADLVYSQEPRAREAAMRIRDEFFHAETATG